jgi:hypothetical protein
MLLAEGVVDESSLDSARHAIEHEWEHVHEH